MGFKNRDRVWENTSSSGLLDFALAGAIGSPYEAFNATGNYSDGDTFKYCAFADAQWETATGTYVAATNKVQRPGTVDENSSGTTSPINFASAPQIFVTFTAAFAQLLVDTQAGRVLTGTTNGLPVWAASSVAVPTRQVLTSGTTYTTPANVRQLKIRMIGGGGGGSGGGVAGSVGATTTFNSIVANGGSGANSPGTGATSNSGNGTGTASLRVIGAANSLGMNVSPQNMPGGQGGSGAFGGGGGGSGWWSGAGSTAGSVNSGGGGGGGSGSYNSGGGGGSGDYVEIIINSPAASYTYAIGGGGAAGNTGASFNASAGGSGLIIVDEIY